jgi:hypothetical protein
MGSTLFVLLFVSTGTAAALKGRWLLFAVGVLVGPAVWALAFLVPARPRSWWFVHVYDDEKRVRAERLAPFRRH